MIVNTSIPNMLIPTYLRSSQTMPDGNHKFFKWVVLILWGSGKRPLIDVSILCYFSNYGAVDSLALHVRVLRILNINSFNTIVYSCIKLVVSYKHEIFSIELKL